MKKIVYTAILSSLATLLLTGVTAAAIFPQVVKLENPWVRVSQITYEPGVPRDRYLRASNQLIVFLDDCKYERLDSKTGEKTIRERKSGDVIWHDRSEDAPRLTNLGAKPYRTLLVEIK